jgi:hypothetical protein
MPEFVVFTGVKVGFFLTTNYTSQTNHQLDATISPVYYPDDYLQLNTFWASSRPSSEAQQLQQQPLVLPLEGGGSSAVGRGRTGRPAGRPDHDKQHCYHLDPKVKPEAATAVVEFLMMGVMTLKTC